MRRRQVSIMALAMQPGCEEGFEPRTAPAARDGGHRSRMWIPGRTMRRESSLPEGVLATAEFLATANRYARADCVRFLGLLDRIGLGATVRGDYVGSEATCRRGQRGRFLGVETRKGQRLPVTRGKIDPAP